MRILVTICSRQKSDRSGKIPAHLRYCSGRIDTCLSEAEIQNVPFLILSGKYGLIEPDTLIPNYDYLLDWPMISELADRVATKLQANSVTQVDFYSKPAETPGWGPYVATMDAACKRAGAELVIFPYQLPTREQLRKRGFKFCSVCNAMLIKRRIEDSLCCTPCEEGEPPATDGQLQRTWALMEAGDAQFTPLCFGFTERQLAKLLADLERTHAKFSDTEDS